VEKAVEEHLSQDRYSDAANALYQFVWNEFCDWYLEFVKPIIYGQTGTPGEKRATQLVLAQTLNRIMRLLHPFVPFITEEIYQKLPIHGEACIVDTYPTTKNDKEWLSVGSKDAAFEMTIVKEVIAAIRNIRGENRISPAIKIAARVATEDAATLKVLKDNTHFILSLGRLEKFDVDTKQGETKKCAVAPISIDGARLQVILPLEGLVDMAEEIKRIQKEIDKAQKDLSLAVNKLSSETFVKNAPAEIIELEKTRKVELTDKIAQLKVAMERLN
jgi:valyl-tRNA synthetase